MRVEYCYLRARSERWTEEVDKVLEEMRASGTYFMKRAEWWCGMAFQRE